MTRASNPVHYRTDADRTDAYASIGLCPVCGMQKTGCLHVTVAHMMAPDAWGKFAATNPTYDQLRDKRLELVNALPTETRGKDEAIRIPTDRLDTTWTARQTQKGA